MGVRERILRALSSRSSAITEAESLAQDFPPPIDEANFKVLLWQLRAKGLIEEAEIDRWRLTEKGRKRSSRDGRHL